MVHRGRRPRVLIQELRACWIWLPFVIVYHVAMRLSLLDLRSARRGCCAILSLLVVSVMVAACGGATRAPREPVITRKNGTLTKQDLIAAADPICRRIKARRTGVVPGSPRDAHRLPGLVGDEWRAIDELSRLSPPPSMAYDWRQMLNDTRTMAEFTAAVASYSQAGYQGEVSTLLAMITEGERKLHRLARRDGFGGCAQA